MGCILRHDLKTHLEEMKKCHELGVQVSSRWQHVGRGDEFHDAMAFCPIISSDDAIMLWRARRKS